jgi:hypothetical protein
MANEAEGTEKLSSQGIIDFLKGDEKKEDKEEELNLEEELGESKEKPVEKEEKEEKEVELEEEEEEEEKPAEEELELSETLSRKAILKKYPNLFKEFPGIQRAIYREQAYTETFPTIEDAKAANEKGKEFDKFERELLSGKSDGLLEGLKAADKEALLRVSASFLPTLAKVEPSIYQDILGNVFRTAIVQMMEQGQTRNNNNLKIAAQIFNEFLFGDAQIRAPQQLVAPKNEKVDEQAEREARFRERELGKAAESITDKVVNLLSSTVERYIDPNELMTGYARKNAIKDVLAEVDEAIDTDTRFKATYNKLWEKAAEDDFSAASLDRIKRAYLGKAKTLLAPAIKKIRAEVLKGSLKKEKGADEKPVSANRAASSRPPAEKQKQQEQRSGKKLTTFELLSQD